MLDLEKRVHRVFEFLVRVALLVDFGEFFQAAALVCVLNGEVILAPFFAEAVDMLLIILVVAVMFDGGFRDGLSKLRGEGDGDFFIFLEARDPGEDEHYLIARESAMP